MVEIALFTTATVLNIQLVESYALFTGVYVEFDTYNWDYLRETFRKMQVSARNNTCLDDVVNSLDHDRLS